MSDRIKMKIILMMSVFIMFVFCGKQEYYDQNKGNWKMAKRSMVLGTRGVVATSQPLASQAGLDILKQGGNAVDAAVAAAAVLNVVEPMSTGIGGDAFILIYLAKQKKLLALNASGRSPYEMTREKILESGHEKIPYTGMLPVTVPGAFDGWCEVLEKYGTMSLEQVLAPAIHYAQNGFAVTEIIAHVWKENEEDLSKHPVAKDTYLINGKAPKIGELFIQKNFAGTLRILAKGGRDAFYKGEIARQIVEFSGQNGGYLSMKDFEDHTSTWVEPVSADYKGYTLFECPPNGQGIAALEMLKVLENVDMKSLGHNSARYLHYLIESKKLAFADIGKWVGDPEFNDLPVKKMASAEYGKQQFARINPAKAQTLSTSGIPGDGDTIYLTVMDKDNNAVSFINSIYYEFGSGMVAGKTGICLQNRGALFSMEKGHVNMIEPHKRPFHTIIPAMVFKNGEFYMTYGVMGGSMQPQGHVQVLLNMVEFGMNIQEAIEAPRFRHYDDNTVELEPEIGPDVRNKLTAMGHKITPHEQGSYGGGQGIVLKKETGVKMGGSDFRKDGCAVGW